MTIRLVLRNGKEIDMKCKEISSNAKLTENGMISSYESKGITAIKIAGVDFSEIVAVYRLMTDEVSDDETNGGENNANI